MLGRFLFHVCENVQYDEASVHSNNMNKAVRAAGAYKVDGHLSVVQTGRWTCVSVHLVGLNTSSGS